MDGLGWWRVMRQAVSRAKMSGQERRELEERTRTVNVEVEGLVGHVEVGAREAAGEREDVGVMHVCVCACACHRGH